jgi:hypothetical protein
MSKKYREFLIMVNLNGEFGVAEHGALEITENKPIPDKNKITNHTAIHYIEHAALTDLEAKLKIAVSALKMWQVYGATDFDKGIVPRYTWDTCFENGKDALKQINGEDK